MRVSSRSLTLGIDLAAQPKETAACLISWSEVGAVVERLVCPLDDDAIVTMIEADRPLKVAIDAPFGWPSDFVNAVAAWDAGAHWQGGETRVLRLRLTDRVVIQEALQQPLSVSSDRIAVTAWRCARLLTRLAVNGVDVARDGSGLVVEVYPAAALRRWLLDPKGYKGAKPENRRKRELLVTTIIGGCGRPPFVGPAAMRVGPVSPLLAGSG
jgi:hypothetical protein